MSTLVVVVLIALFILLAALLVMLRAGVGPPAGPRTGVLGGAQARAPAQAADVVLVPGRGSAGTGGGEGGFFWHVFCKGERAGKVYINMEDGPLLGRHPALSIFLNKQSRLKARGLLRQGRHIGRWAYQKACMASPYNVVYAHIRKGNLASRRAAEAAGFREYSDHEMDSAARLTGCCLRRAAFL